MAQKSKINLHFKTKFDLILITKFFHFSSKNAAKVPTPGKAYPWD
uniref:Uncharacterized protein n=1 Tax=Lutzomyia longipalpis TaxID=7200 RepID=A0A1B0CSB6_LUTLO